jgi:predicted O-methyltransferase YrrM
VAADRKRTMCYRDKTMPIFRSRTQNGMDAAEAAPVAPLGRSIDGLWGSVMDYAAEIRKSSFMTEINRHLRGPQGHGLIGDLDGATLYGLTRWLRPAVIVESGGYLGGSSAFILKALADEGLTQSTLYSVEADIGCDHGALIPAELRPRFVPLRGKVEDVIKTGELPASIDMFLHDSSHRYRHMVWEFRHFWSRLRDGGLLVSHDVHVNEAFVEFVASTQARDVKGNLDAAHTTHHEWGRWGYLGFIVKKRI